VKKINRTFYVAVIFIFLVCVVEQGFTTDDPIPTNEWINVYCAEPLMNGIPLSPGDTIRAYDPDGVLCGLDVVKANGSFGFMPIYHDDGFTPGVDEGALSGDMISFSVNNFDMVTNPIIIWTFNGDTSELCNFNTCNMQIVPDSIWKYYQFAIDPLDVTIYLGNLGYGHSVDDIDTSTVRINENVIPTSMIILDSFPDFDGKVMEITVTMWDFIMSYPLMWDSAFHTYVVTGQYSDQPNTFEERCEVWMRGHISGDINGDGHVTVLDVMYLKAYLYENGRSPEPCEEAADVNGTFEINILDISYILRYLYMDGPKPFCPQTNY